MILDHGRRVARRVRYRRHGRDPRRREPERLTGCDGGYDPAQSMPSSTSPPQTARPSSMQRPAGCVPPASRPLPRRPSAAGASRSDESRPPSRCSSSRPRPARPPCYMHRRTPDGGIPIVTCERAQYDAQCVGRTAFVDGNFEVEYCVPDTVYDSPPPTTASLPTPPLRQAPRHAPLDWARPGRARRVCRLDRAPQRRVTAPGNERRATLPRSTTPLRSSAGSRLLPD